MWGMQKAGIDLPSTSNFVLDRLQGSPQQFLMLHLSHPAPPPPPPGKCLQSDLEETLDRVGPQINPIPFDSGHIGKRDIKGQCHRIRAGVAGSSCAARNGGFPITAGGGGLRLCLKPRGVSLLCP